MSVDPSQVVQSQRTSVGTTDRASSPGLEESSAGASAVSPSPESASTNRVAEEATHHSMKQSSAELTEIANEVRRIRTRQTRETDQVGRPQVVETQQRSNRPGDANVIVGATKNDALSSSGRPDAKVEVTVFDLENKLASEPERVPSDFAATIREMQQIRRQPLSHYDPAPSDSRRLNEAVRIEMDARRQIEINELISKRGNDFGGGLVNMNPSISYQEIVKNTSDYGTNKSEDSEYRERLPEGAMDSKPGVANAGTKVAGSLERYAAAAQFAEKTQVDVGSKSLEQIKESLRRLGAFDKSTGSK